MDLLCCSAEKCSSKHQMSDFSSWGEASLNSVQNPHEKSQTTSDEQPKLSGVLRVRHLLNSCRGNAQVSPLPLASFLLQLIAVLSCKVSGLALLIRSQKHKILGKVEKFTV